MRKITKFQNDFDCLPYSFFIREHQYERKTQCYETEIIDMRRQGNYVYLRPSLGSNYFLSDDGWERWDGKGSRFNQVQIPFFASSFEEDYYKYLDIKITVAFDFSSSSSGAGTKYSASKDYYLSAYVGNGLEAENPDEENAQLFCGYDYDKLDSLPIKNQNIVTLFKSLSRGLTTQAVNLFTLSKKKLQQIKENNTTAGTNITTNYFQIPFINVQLLQRRAFFEIGDQDPYKEYVSTLFGKGNSISITYKDIEHRDKHEEPNVEGGKYYYPFLVKNEIIKQDVNIKKKVINFEFDKYCGYYTTDRAVLPVGQTRFLTKDITYRKSRKAFGVVDLKPNKNWSITISDDTNPDDVVFKAILQTFSCSYNENGLLYLKITDGDKDNTIKISSTVAEDDIGNSENKGCKEEFQFEEYFFDTKITRNNKVIKIIVKGINIDDEYLRLGVYAEVVKNTTIYERYQKVAAS